MIKDLSEIGIRDTNESLTQKISFDILVIS